MSKQRKAYRSPATSISTLAQWKMSEAQAPRRRAKDGTFQNGGMLPHETIDLTKPIGNRQFGFKQKDNFTIQRLIGRTLVWLYGMLLVLMQAGPMVGLIFGGCCSNVCTLHGEKKNSADVNIDWRRGS